MTETCYKHARSTALTDFDPAAMLRTDEAIEVFLDDAFQTGDAQHIAAAIGAAARAKGMTKIARETGQDQPAFEPKSSKADKLIDFKK